MQTGIIAALCAQISAIEQTHGTCPLSSCLPFGVPRLDACLPGQGLAIGAVHELFAGGPAVEHGAAPALFTAAVLARRVGPVLWIAARRDLYPPALARAGLDPARLVFVHARRGALRAMEESLRHPGFAGMIYEHQGRLDLVASRRLQLEAGATGALGFILRRSPRFGVLRARHHLHRPGAQRYQMTSGTQPACCLKTYCYQASSCRSSQPICQRRARCPA